MRVSLNWLREYVPIPVDARELAKRLTHAGLEVESVDKVDDLSGVVVGEILEAQVVPTTKLWLCRVDVGEEILSIVCGAPNVSAGEKVAVAKEGTTLPQGLSIVSQEIKGILSCGMLCSEKELGLGDDASGLMILEPHLVPGTPMKDAYFLEDWVLDVSVYANRPDCMSMLGIAREVACLFREKVNDPTSTIEETKERIEDVLQISILDPALCPRYSGRVLRGITLKPSPLWMQSYLRAAGMRPINNVVDITNFVMLETGQPLHAFDFAKIKGAKICVRAKKAGESLVTLDGVKRELDPSMILICDAEEPVALGGVMGGLHSEVDETTRDLLLESASFQARSIRHTGKKLGITSEAQSRFEKGVYPEGTLLAMERATALLMEYASASVVKGVLDVHTLKPKERKISLDIEAVEALLGAKIPEEEMLAILEGLEFQVDTTAVPWVVTYPSFRQDLELQEDLIEEILRFYGFDKIEATRPYARLHHGAIHPSLQVAQRLKDTLTSAGLHEAVNYSFVSADAAEPLAGLSPMIPLLNPLSEELAYMRTSLLPGLLLSAARNLSRQQNQVALFEVGSVYLAKELPLKEQPKEQKELAILVAGERDSTWEKKGVPYDFYDLKGYVEMALEDIGQAYRFAPGNLSYLHPGRQLLILQGDIPLGFLGECHPTVQKAYKLPCRSLVASLSLDSISYAAKEVRVCPLPKYPGITRDLALLLPDHLFANEVLQALVLSIKEKHLKSAQIFDVYQGPQVPKGMKSVAFSFFFQGDRTLREAEVQEAMEQIKEVSRRKFGAEIR